MVSYANDVKTGVLGVNADDIARHGAVSQPVVEQMAAGTSDKPVGTVWIAVRCGNRTTSRCFHFVGDRSRVIEQATTRGLIMLIKLLGC